MLRKFGIIAVLSLLAVAFAAVPALAQKSGAHELQSNPIVCTTDGTIVTCSGTVVGLGGNITQANTVVEADFACATKRSGHQPGGHLQGDSGPLPVTSGRIDFTVETGPATCPPGLRATIGPTATVSIFSGDTLLFTTTENIQFV
jgi:hypothetical protein